MLKLAVFFVVFIILVVLFLMLKKLKFSIKFENSEGKTKLDIMVFLFSDLKIYHYKIKNAFDTDLSKESKIENYKRIFEKFIKLFVYYRNHKKLVSIFEDLLARKASISEVDIKVLYGNGIPSDTAIICGFLWAIFGVFISLLKNKTDVDETKLCIRSLYSKKDLRINISCIFSVRLVNTISIAIYILKEFIKNKKTKKGGASIGSTPNRRTYENSYGKH